MSKKLKNGDIAWTKTHFRHICCDCGLEHFVSVDLEVSKRGKRSTIVPNDRWVAMRYYRDEDATKTNRKRRRIKIKRA